MSEGEEFEFVCPECRETISLNGPMRTAMIENGCVVCGAEVGAENFERNGAQTPEE